MTLSSYRSSVFNVFSSPTKLILAALLVIVNAIVAVNAWFHDPRIGYDAMHHLHYLEALCEFRFVTNKDTSEFFSPPLPYLLPAAFMAWTGNSLLHAAKFAQAINVLLSIGTTVYLTKTLSQLNNQKLVPILALLFLGSFPVYYKTFAFVRGEPYVVFFLSMAMYHFSNVFIQKRFEHKQVLLLGFALGAGLLSRQWSMFFVMAVGIYAVIDWAYHSSLRGKIFNALLVTILTAFVCSGWFYLELSKRYGSMTAFNRQPNTSFQMANQPLDFYFGTGNGNLFSKPVRPNFPNQLFPILYSETWGDYWGYFFIYSKDLRKNDNSRMTGLDIENIMRQSTIPDWMGTNYFTGGKYLGRVNLLALLPSFIALVAMAFAITRLFGKNKVLFFPKGFLLFQLLVLFITMTGYQWFLIMYPNLGKGDTIKASYILQIFPVLAILSSHLLVAIHEWEKKLFWSIIVTVILIWLHNLPVMLTHFPLSNVPWG